MLKRLLHLLGRGPTTTADLERELDVSAPMLLAMLGNLERAGLVTQPQSQSTCAPARCRSCPFALKCGGAEERRDVRAWGLTPAGAQKAKQLQ